MLFSSAIFLYLFLPIVLLGYYLFPFSIRNAWLMLASLIFFAWGGVSYSIILIASIACNYIFGILIGNNLGTRKAKIYLAFGVAINLLLLAAFKYAMFAISNLNTILGFENIAAINIPKIILPIGISFYTFHSLSYLVDIYRRDAIVQRKPVDLMLYISFFPQLIAGPIIRYHYIADQLGNRTHTTQKFAHGIERFIIGLAKKVLLANTFALAADTVFKTDIANLSALNAWLGIAAYTLQIYFDFSGYSDMAIGLALMFGFEFPENFNLPYIARSIKEFWRRWHISLSTWFKDYLYIPLGGNRLGTSRMYVNLIIVFFITGFWHGASWTFVVWGLFHGSFLIIERIGLGNILDKSPKIISNFYTLIVVMMGWVLFRADDFSLAGSFYKALFNFSLPLNELSFFRLTFTRDFWFALTIGVPGALGVFTLIQQKVNNVSPKINKIIRYSFEVGYVIVLAGLLFLCSIYLIAGTYNPFIYFRF